ncbi:hypothetical protein [Hyphomonas oceanitis]|uniref:hypothetical protein n=1 Tax=Hyphomonas oceanitis TaxID=81033 RepID=UPI003002524F
MSNEEKNPYPDPRVLAEQYFEQSEKYIEQGNEAYRFHSQAGKQLFIRYRFYLLGLIVAGIGFAILNRELSSPLIERWPEITTIRAALCIWAAGVAVGLFSIQTTITSHFIDADNDSSFFSHRAQFSGLAGRQHQRIAGGLQEDAEIEKEISEMSVQHEKDSEETQKERERLIHIEFLQSSICAGCFFFGSAIFAIPLFV